MLTAEQRKMRDDALIYNLRYRWKTELEDYSDRELVDLYNDFAIGDWYGDNDARFLEFVSEFGD